MPHAIERDRELRDKGLVTLFFESQGSPAPALPGFLWSHWAGFDARVAPNGGGMPLPRSGGLPFAVLLGVDGTVLWSGNPIDGDKQTRELLDGELAKVQKGFGPDPDTRRVRALLYGKQAFADAKKAIDGLRDAALQASLRQELEAARGRRVRAVQFLLDDARPVEARKALEALQRGCTGVPEWLPELAAAQKALAAPELAKELATDEKFQRLAESLRGGKHLKASDLLATLEPIVKAGAGTKVAARLQKLVDGIRGAAKE